MSSPYYTDPDEPLDIEALPSIIMGDAVSQLFMKRFRRLNYLIHEAADNILDIQRDLFGNDADGNILLRLYDCGEGCLGCPHYRWRIVRVNYRRAPGKARATKRFLVQHNIKQPGRVGKVMREPTLQLAVSDANRLLAARASLIEPVIKLARHMAQTNIPHTNLVSNVLED